MKRMHFLLFIRVLLFISATFFFAGCGPEETHREEKGDDRTRMARPQEPIRLVYPDWSSETASAHLIQAVLQERLGYTVELIPVKVEEMWRQVASGEADVLAGAWLPVTHKDYYAEYGDRVVDLGANLTGARIGLVVPTVIPSRQTAATGKTGRKLVTIKTIEQLRGVSDRFAGKIIGIESGAGVVSRSKEALTAYGIQHLYRVVETDERRMVNRVTEAIHREKWIVFTGWRPHWFFERYNLRFLEDPKNVFGGEESIHTMVRKGFEKDMPEAYTALSRIEYNVEDLERLMEWIRVAEDEPYLQALRWIDVYEQRVDAWVAGLE